MPGEATTAGRDAAAGGGARGNGFRRDPRGLWSEAGGALGDLGTLLPLTLGAVAVAGLAPGPVLAGFGVAYVATALLYRLPVPVQPMKAVSAVLVTAGAMPASLAASGAMPGAVLLVLGLSGGADRLARLVPQSVAAGLQLGLGLALALIALELMARSPAVGAAALAAILLLLRRPVVPAAMGGLLAALATAWASGEPAGGAAWAAGGVPLAFPAVWALPGLPSAAELRMAVCDLVLPQLALTLTNAVLLTALVAGDLFGERAAHVTPRRLALSSGAATLVLAPLGALPMCHGAGGLAAHHRFGARTGTAPLLVGAALLALALVPGGAAALALVPEAGTGALLLVAAGELALSRRLLDARPSCRPVIAAAAAATLLLDPFLGLLAGALAEVLRRAVLRRLARSPGA